LETKVLVYIAVGAIVAIIAVIATLPGTGLVKTLIPQNQNVPSALTAITADIKPIQIQYNGSSISSVTDRDATIQTKFDLTNPNNTTVILEMISYDVYVNGVQMGHGQYGQRYEGSWESSYYLPLTQHNSETVTNNAQLSNDGNNPQIWSAMQSGSANIRINGTAFYSTNTAFSGGSYSTSFDFPK